MNKTFDNQREMAEQLFYQIQKDDEFKGCQPYRTIEITLRTFGVNERGGRYIAACPTQITGTIIENPDIEQRLQETACEMLEQMIRGIKDGSIKLEGG